MLGGGPDGFSWAEPWEVGCSVRRRLPTSVRAVGLRQVDGIALGTQPACVGWGSWAVPGLRTIAVGGMTHYEAAAHINDAEELFTEVAQIAVEAGRTTVPKPRQTTVRLRVLEG